ncbi:threonine/serine exporter family protein [Clostridium sp. Marseille-Q2269]|uniref:threonine/serine exporter family protein n=1 Tax=Clostridium sp. Marseille-Q2269 TaxID=2942205 RepID=UPI0020735B29|nr:threonine/serine exporter family protein [Clostridium sp. Marseille-Q2269]
MIVMTMKDKERRHYTQSVRINSTATDLGQLEALNAMAREICSKAPSISEIGSALENNNLRKENNIVKCLGYMLSAGSFAVFFGGAFIDGMAASIIAIGILGMDHFFQLRKLNRVIYTVIASFLSGCLAQLCEYIGFCMKVDKVIIGNIMLFILALVLINGVKEMFYQDIMTGLYRLIEAFMIAVSIAIGFVSSVILLGSVF